MVGGITMRATIGKFIIESDSRQYVVYERCIVNVETATKEENIGKEYNKPIGYFNHLEEAYKFIGERTVKTNDDVEIILNKLQEIINCIKEEK